MDTFTLSPSDLTFLWDGCKFCFYMKVRHKITYHAPFPGMFGTMGDLTSRFYLDKPAVLLSPGLPAGIVRYKEMWVKSAPISFADIDSHCVIRGRFDAVIEFEDGSFGVVDYKTSNASQEKAAFYSRQLSAYAYALENPAPGTLHLSPVTRLGLFILTPQRYEEIASGEAAFVTAATWMDVPRDDPAFFSFLGGVMAVLEADDPPPSAETCPLCAYRRAMQGFGERQLPFPGMALE